MAGPTSQGGRHNGSVPPGAYSAFLRSLRAVRRYADRPVPDDVLLDLLDVARWTGSAKNTQPWELLVVRDRATLAELAGCGPYAGHLAGAAAAIVLLMQDGQRRFDEDRLAQNLMLAAWAHGVVLVHRLAVPRGQHPPGASATGCARRLLAAHVDRARLPGRPAGAADQSGACHRAGAGRGADRPSDAERPGQVGALRTSAVGLMARHRGDRAVRR